MSRRKETFMTINLEFVMIPKKMFQVFKKFCGKNKSNSCKLEVNDMNKFFATIGPQLSIKFVEFKYNDKISRNSDTFLFFPLKLMKWRRLLRI